MQTVPMLGKIVIDDNQNSVLIGPIPVQLLHETEAAFRNFRDLQ